MTRTDVFQNLCMPRSNEATWRCDSEYTARIWDVYLIAGNLAYVFFFTSNKISDAWCNLHVSGCWSDLILRVHHKAHLNLGCSHNTQLTAWIGFITFIIPLAVALHRPWQVALQTCQELLQLHWLWHLRCQRRIAGTWTSPSKGLWPGSGEVFTYGDKRFWDLLQQRFEL